MLKRFYQAMKARIDRQKLLYVLVGLFNTGVGILAFTILYLLLRGLLHYQWITLIAHFGSVGSSWLMHRHFVFKSQAPAFLEYLRFNLTSLFMLSFQMMGLYLFVDYLQIHPLISQPFVVVLGLILSYVIHSRFTFS